MADMSELYRIRGMLADPLFNTLPRLEQARIRTRAAELESLARRQGGLPVVPGTGPGVAAPGSSTYLPLAQRETEQRQAEERRTEALAQSVRERAGRMDVAPDYYERMQAGAAMPYPGLPSPAPDIQAPASTPAPTPDATGAPPPAPPAPNPLQAMVDRMLAGGRGGSPIPNIPRIDVEKLKGEIPKVGEREAQETYKADPYMTMLQTGLRILAAKPELGQSPISAIAGPVLTGAEQYRGEREKERTSKREEAKEARADQYARAEAAKSTASLAISALKANQDAAGKELELRQRAAQHGDTTSIERAKLAIQMPLNLAHARYYESMANKTPQQLAQDAEIFEKKYASQQLEYINENTTPQKRAQLEIEMEHTKRLLGLVYGTGRAEVAAAAGIGRAQTAARQKEIDEAVKTMANPTVPDAIREDAKRRYFELTGKAPTELPPPPR
jgi:hypothetical protein